MPKTAKEDLWVNADRSKVVSADSADAAFLLARAGSPLYEGDVTRYKIKTEDAPVYDAVADHEAKHGGETDAQAADARRRMVEGQPDPDGPAVAGERGNLDVKAADAPQDTKAVTRAPANKAQ